VEEEIDLESFFSNDPEENLRNCALAVIANEMQFFIHDPNDGMCFA
jgi:hypothetical protein